MRPVYAVWVEPHNARPWIAVIRRSLKLMKWTDWVLCVTMVAALPLIPLFLARDDFLHEFAGGIVAGLLGAFAHILERRKGVRSRGIRPTRNPDPWTHVLVEIKRPLVSELQDNGVATVERGRLMYSGAHCSFQINLSEVEITESNTQEQWLQLWIKPTKQSVLFRHLDQDSSQWQSFITGVYRTLDAGAGESTYPPKPNVDWLSGLAWSLSTATVSAAIVWISVLASDYLPFSPLFSVATIVTLSCAATVALALILNVRFWHSQLRRGAALASQNKKADRSSQTYPPS
jgi:hypothetical protein